MFLELFLTPDGVSRRPHQEVTGSQGERSLWVPQEVPRARPLSRAWSVLSRLLMSRLAGHSERKERDLTKNSANLVILSWEGLALGPAVKSFV